MLSGSEASQGYILPRAAVDFLMKSFRCVSLHAVMGFFAPLRMTP